MLKMKKGKNTTNLAGNNSNITGSPPNSKLIPTWPAKNISGKSLITSVLKARFLCKIYFTSCKIYITIAEKMLLRQLKMRKTRSRISVAWIKDVEFRM